MCLLPSPLFGSGGETALLPLSSFWERGSGGEAVLRRAIWGEVN